MSQKHTAGAIAAAEAITGEVYGKSEKLFDTGLGKKNVIGIADCIDINTNAAELQSALEVITNVVGHNSCTDGRTPNGFVIALDKARAILKKLGVNA
jgi:hypothetical protein